MSTIVVLVLAVDGADLNTDERADLARQLRGELLALDIVAVQPVSAGPLPPGAKAGEAIAFGALAVSLAPEIMTRLLDVVTSWLRRQRSHIYVEIDGQHLQGQVSREQRDAIVAAYLSRVASKEAS
jgi:hypothetical protein